MAFSALLFWPLVSINGAYHSVIIFMVGVSIVELFYQKKSSGLMIAVVVINAIESLVFLSFSISVYSNTVNIVGGAITLFATTTCIILFMHNKRNVYLEIGYIYACMVSSLWIFLGRTDTIAVLIQGSTVFVALYAVLFPTSRNIFLDQLRSDTTQYSEKEKNDYLYDMKCNSEHSAWAARLSLYEVKKALKL